VFLTVDREAGAAVDGPFRARLAGELERFRMAGQDLEIVEPSYVPVDLALEVCVRPGYFRADVKRALLEALGNRDFLGGRGFFHPDNLTFAAPLYLSQIYQRAAAVDGVESVSVSRFQRFGLLPDGERDAGVLRLGVTEIARLDNDPSFPENGRLDLAMRGGL
jgi:hypothetical protein